MRNPFSRKKQDQDTMEILRQAFLENEVSREQNDPTITFQKIETVKIEEHKEPETVEAKPVSPLEEFGEEISEEDLNLLKRLFDVFRGKVEIGNRLRPLLNPENLQTTSRLSETQVDFVTDAHWLASQWKVFEPLRDLANELCETNISEGGKGRQEAISFVGALTEGKLIKSLMLAPEIPKKSRFPLVGKRKEATEGES